MLIYKVDLLVPPPRFVIAASQFAILHMANGSAVSSKQCMYKRAPPAPAVTESHVKIQNNVLVWPLEELVVAATRRSCIAFCARQLQLAARKTECKRLPTDSYIVLCALCMCGCGVCVCAR